MTTVEAYHHQKETFGEKVFFSEILKNKKKFAQVNCCQIKAGIRITPQEILAMSIWAVRLIDRVIRGQCYITFFLSLS